VAGPLIGTESKLAQRDWFAQLPGLYGKDRGAEEVSFLSELKRRNVFRMAGLYLGAPRGGRNR